MLVEICDCIHMFPSSCLCYHNLVNYFIFWFNMSNITSSLLRNTSIMPSHLVLPTPAQLSTLSRIPLSIFVDAFPRLLLTTAILFAYLLVPHVKRPMLYGARWMVLAIIVWLEYENVYGLRSIVGGKGHGGGLASGIVMLWAGTWLIWERPQWDAKRVWRRTKVGNVESKVARICCAESITDETTVSSTIRYRSTKDFDELVDSSIHTHAVEYYWQSYPTDSFRDRVLWTADLLLNFRGPGWNWAIHSLPSMPPHVLHDLGLPITPSSKNGISKTGLQRATSKSQIYSDIVPHALLNWAVFHFCCFMLVTDPYFMLGATSTAPPPLHLALIPSFVLICLRRALLGLVILASLELNNSFLLLNPILGPKYLGLHGEIWYYHTAFGSFHNITNYGLAGFWGGFWHQSFREAFTAPSDYLVRKGWLDG